jgi:hypothetical protein
LATEQLNHREDFMMTNRFCTAILFLASSVLFTGEVSAAERCVPGNLTMCGRDQALTCVRRGKENGWPLFAIDL